MDQVTLKSEHLTLFTHVIIYIKAIFMNYIDEQVCKDDENKKLKMKKNPHIIYSKYQFFWHQKIFNDTFRTIYLIITSFKFEKNRNIFILLFMMMI